MDVAIDFYIGCLIALPIAQSFAAFWPMTIILSICSLSIIILHKPRVYGSKIIWVGFATLFCLALIDQSTLRNLALFPIYGLAYWAGLQIREVRLGKLLSFLIIPQIIAIIVLHFIWPLRGNGGLIAPGDYNVPSALMMIAFLLSYQRWQWLLFPFLILGLYMTGGEEPIILLAGLSLLIVIRRDFSRRLLPSLGMVVVCVVLYFGLHTPLYLYEVSQDQLAMIQHTTQPYATDSEADVMRGRSLGYTEALSSISVLGHGMDAWNISTTSIHNIPLRILSELGLLGLAAYLLIIGKWVTKTNVYLSLLLVVMMLFDHYLWTLIGVWLWAILGLTYQTTSTYIFRH